MKRLLSLLLCALLCLPLCACGGGAAAPAGAPVIEGLTYESTLPLEYADQFAVYKYEGGYAYIDMVNSDKLLVVPEGGAVPQGLDPAVVVVQQPLNNVYLVSTSAMALFDALGAMDTISFVGTKQWYIESAARAMQDGLFQYAGKYNAPDYELLLNGGCRLAIESTMILHNPEVKEQLMELGVPTVVERSSYENHPLGRTEWVKLYGVLLGREAEAAAAFEREAAQVRALEALAPTGKTVAFFSVNSNGSVVAYKSDGYLPEMIRIAGGAYLPADLGSGDEGKLSTVNMSMEDFYASARDADVIIYNCSIVSQLHDLQEFLDLSPVLEDFKAVQTGQVWCTSRSLFQQTDRMGSIIREMNAILTGDESVPLTYIFRLQ